MLRVGGGHRCGIPADCRTRCGPSVRRCGKRGGRGGPVARDRRRATDPQLRRARVFARRATRSTSRSCGREGLEQALTHPYDLVILDLLMPTLDGRTVLRRILERKPGQAVLVLSALTDTQTKVEALELGAEDYLAKPFSLAELLARVRARLRGVARSGAGQRPRRHDVARPGPPRGRAGKRAHPAVRARVAAAARADAEPRRRRSRRSGCCPRSGATTSSRGPTSSTCTSAGCGPSSARTRSRPCGERAISLPWGDDADWPRPPPTVVDIAWGVFAVANLVAM